MKRRFHFSGPDLFEYAMETSNGETISLNFAPATVGASTGTGVFVPFQPLLKITGAPAHPTQLVESAALAAIRPPAPKHIPVLPAHIIQNGLLSDAQLEALALIGDAHQGHISIRETEPPFSIKNYRRGFKLGAGPGVGKGRIAAAVIVENMQAGRNRALWITETNELYDSAVRDWLALGQDRKKIITPARYNIAAPITLSEGVIICTYAMLRSTVKNKKGEITHRRLDQFLKWMQEDGGEGVVIFDESQNLQNAISRQTKQKNGRQPVFVSSSKQGTISLELQKAMPKARILYSSATSDDHLESLAYAPRLGLWGAGTAFPSRSDFLNSMQQSGVTALEVACQHLKSRGLYWAPQLGAEGVTTEILTHMIDKDDVVRLNSFSDFWKSLSGSVTKALITTRAAIPGSKKGTLVNLARTGGYAFGALRSAEQRFYTLAYMSIRMPSVLAHMRERLAAGESCVLQAHNTFESAQKAALQEFDASKDALADLVISPRKVITDYLREQFPVQQHEIYYDPDTKKQRARPMTDPRTGTMVINSKAEAIRENILQQIETLMMPDNPFDRIIEEFGVDNVAEVTGRKERLLWENLPNGKRKRIRQKRSKRDNVKEIEAFNNGPKRVLFFSEAKGGIGQSYHSDLSFKNTTRRNHYLLQVPWRAIDAVQGLGRTHRTNQASSPNYVLTTTSVPAEARFISTIAARLGQLGALTRGDREASGSPLIDSSMSFEGPYAEEGLTQMVEEIAAGMDKHISNSAFLEQTGINAQHYITLAKGQRHQHLNVTRFLNRLFTAHVDLDGGWQGKLLDALAMRTDERVGVAMAAGTYDPGLRTIDGKSVTIADREPLNCDPKFGQIEILNLKRVKIGNTILFDEALRRYTYHNTMHRGDGYGFVIREDGVPELHLPIYDKSEIKSKRILTPSREYVVADTLKRHNTITQAEAKDAWDIAAAKPRRTHVVNTSLICGAILPMWNALRNFHPTIWKAITDDGVPLIGVRIPGKYEAGQLAAMLQNCIDKEYERIAADGTKKAAQEAAVTGVGIGAP